MLAQRTTVPTYPLRHLPLRQRLRHATRRYQFVVQELLCQRVVKLLHLHHSIFLFLDVFEYELDAQGYSLTRVRV